jgi:hypothetical protein
MMGHPKQTFKVNLSELLGGKHEVDEATRQSIGQAVIDRIVERTSVDSIDRYGKSLGRYSKSYANSLSGQVFGKKAGGDVTLLATGDMLGSLTIVASTADTITIGYEDDAQNTKAYGHISGMKGHPILEGKVKPRNFLGLPATELDAIGSDFEDQVAAIESINSAGTKAELDQSILKAIEQLGWNLGDGDGG